MPVGSAILSTANVNPEVLAVGGLEDELIKISVMLKEIKPASGHLHIGMLAVVVPGRI